MPADPPASALLPLASGGRSFTAGRPVRLGDVDMGSQLRLDAVARYLQDVATDDAEASGLANVAGWVVRRSLIDVRAPAELGEQLELITFCSGTGRSWAERRTSVVGDQGAHLEAVSLWVQVDPTTGRPAALGDDFFAIYGSATAGRRVSARLGLPKPSAAAKMRPWMVRQVDLDPFRHVNNAVQWAVVEEVIEESDQGRRGVADIEFVGAVDQDSTVEMCVEPGPEGDPMAWLVVGGEVRTAARWRPRDA